MFEHFWRLELKGLGLLPSIYDENFCENSWSFIDVWQCREYTSGLIQDSAFMDFKFAIWMKNLVINPFLVRISILCPLKTAQKIRFTGVFRGCRRNDQKLVERGTTSAQIGSFFWSVKKTPYVDTFHTMVS